MLDHLKWSDFIEQVRLTPAIWKNVEYGIEKSHLAEIWAHFGHTFDISASEAEDQWIYLIRLHRMMNKELGDTAFRIQTDPFNDVWSTADGMIADSLKQFLKSDLDDLLLIDKITESSV